MDFDLLRILSKKDNYIRFKPYIKEHVLSREAAVLIASMDGYYESHPSETEIDWAQFSSYFLVLRNSKLSPVELSLFKTLLDKLQTSTAPTPAADDLLKHYIKQEYASKIADAAIQVAEGSDTITIDTIAEYTKEYDREVGRAVTHKDIFVSTDISEVVKLAMAPGLEWRLEELNISAGPLRKGDFVIVSAYVNTGKTTFAADQVSYMASQIKDGRPVIWINNEERSSKVMFRIVQAALGITTKDILADPAAAMSNYAHTIGNKDKILIVSEDSSISNVSQMNALFRDMNPALIVFDQLDKVSGFEGKGDSEHNRLGFLYQWGRRLAHEYGSVIALSQADATASGSPWVQQNQLRGSKVDKPGEADLIITIGKDNDPANENKRYIHIAKNKLIGGPRSDENERHGYWLVDIKPEIARYIGTK